MADLSATLAALPPSGDEAAAGVFLGHLRAVAEASLSPEAMSSLRPEQASALLTVLVQVV